MYYPYNVNDSLKSVSFVKYFLYSSYNGDDFHIVLHFKKSKMYYPCDRDDLEIP